MKKLLILFFISFLFGEVVNDAQAQNEAKKCESGDKNACYEAATYYSNKWMEGRQRDDNLRNLEIKYEKMGCDLKHAMSCYSFANNYKEDGGDYRILDMANYTSYMQKSCDYGAVLACAALGDLYKKEMKNLSGGQKKAMELKAKSYYKKACDMKYELSCRYLKQL